MNGDIRKSAIAGSWYPGSPKVLRADIEDFFHNVPEEKVKGRIVGLIAPHAGYMYSGQVAAYAYKLVRGATFDAVIIVGPSHRVPFQGVSVYNRGGYETPLGVVPVDAALAGKIMTHSSVASCIPSAHMQEHSVEIQLPFLQVALGEFSFVPFVMGDQNHQTCEDLAEAISQAIENQNVLIVGSSDLSHFYPYEKAVKMDAVVLAHIERMDAQGLLKDMGNNICEACGGGPAAVIMMVAKKTGADRAKVLKYANSGDVTGDRTSVVGYTSAVLYVSEISTVKDQRHTGVRIERGLSEVEKEILLDIAKKTIECRLTGRDVPEFQVESARLQEKKGVFVTLKKQGQLRGCIGYIEAVKPLYKTIEEMAIAAAFNDPRFPPLKREEFEHLTIEISALTPLTEIKDINEIKVGVHGIHIVKGFYSGLLLPQVAVEHKWDRLTFLEETCHKAGLPSQTWKDKDTKIYIFSADIFGNKE
ncbi:MAG: AmmeMemoRadiSam system protein B [Syntrophales bacterium]|nr:AmmeMemoRadiSam system protein B [Syntrophales bacterium]